MSLLHRPPRVSSRDSKTSPERQEVMRQREAARRRIAQDRAASRNRRVRGSHRSKDKPLLDPHGLYGTRTAQRMRAAKRRQWWQKSLVGVLLTALLTWAWMRWHEPRVGSLRLQASTFVGGEIASLASRSGNQLFWIERSGALRVLDVRNGATKRLTLLNDIARVAPFATANQIFIASENGTLLAVRRSDGKLLWQRKIGVSCSAPPRLGELEVAGKLMTIVFAASDDGVVVALNAQNGQAIWRTSLRATIGNGFVVVGNTLWIPLGAGQKSRGGLACLNASSGARIETFDLGAAHVAALASGDGGRNQNEILSAGDDGAVFCYNSATRKRIWKTFVHPLDNQSRDQAIVLRGEPLVKTYQWGERAFVGGNDGVLRAFDARIGRAQWSHFVGAPLSQRSVSWRLQTVGGERDFVVCVTNKNVRVLDARNGAEEWRIALDVPSQGVFIHDNLLWNIRADGSAERYER